MLKGVLAAACACAALTTSVLHAEQKPLWELGMGVGALGFSDYRGAASSRVYPVPVPYVVYRGEYLQADRDGVRSVLLKNDSLELNISVNATTPVDSDGVAVRRGMPDLDPTFELGPSLDVHLWRAQDERMKLDLRIPLRGAVTIDKDPQWIGLQLAPRVNLDIRDPAGFTGWTLGLLAGPIFADRRYHEYFYAVQPAYATTQRPAYEAHGGYAGSQILASTSRRFARTWFGAFLRYDRLDGAVFADSPLVERRSAWTAGFGVAWIFAESARSVNVPD